MRLHRIIGSGLLVAALLFTSSGTASAETRQSAMLDTATKAVEAAKVPTGFSSQATVSTSEFHDARRSNDIVSTAVRFDTNLINITVEAQGPIVITEDNWVAVQFSFNKSGLPDGIGMIAKQDSSSPVMAVAGNRLGMDCPATYRTHDNKITISINAQCMGHPGAVAYNVMYGDFMSLIDGDFDAVDISPEDGFTRPASEAGGYWLLGADGGVFSFGDAGFYGSTGSMRLNAPVVAMSPSATGKGYSFVAADGGVFSFGDAAFLGSMGGSRLNKPMVAMAPTPSGKGYWLAASDGGIFAYGDAQFYGSMGGKSLNKAIVGMTPTASGKGYWLVASDGGIFAFGDAGFYGSMGGHGLNQPITAMTVKGNGYYLLAADGGIFTFGEANFLGSGWGRVLSATTAMADQPNGYLIADEIGGVYEIGPIYHFGDLVDMGIMPNERIVSLAVLPHQLQGSGEYLRR